MLSVDDKVHECSYLATPLVVFRGDGAKALRGEDLSDNGTVADENDTEWDEVSEESVDPVPWTDEEITKLLVKIAGQLDLGVVADVWRVGVQVEAEEEVHVEAEEQNWDDGPGDGLGLGLGIAHVEAEEQNW